MTRKWHETASQTAGPYVHIGLAPGDAGFEMYGQELGREIARPEAEGQRIRVEGIVIDGAGDPVKDMLLEVWQADAKGQYAQPEDARANAAGFRGWGRAITDFDTGLWGFSTIKPGATEGPNGAFQAPHINFWLVARGVNLGLNTRMYFEDEPEANAADPVLAMIDDPARRDTLIGRVVQGEDGPTYRFDVRLQGEGETVFFDI